MIYCTKCGTENQDDYSFCFKCGAPKNNISNTADSTTFSEFNSKPAVSQEISNEFGDKSVDASLPASMQKVFSYIDEAGGVNLPYQKKLLASKSLKIEMNYWAFCFSFLYLWIKGMWRQSITRFFIALLMLFVFAVMEQLTNKELSNSMWTALNFTITGVCFGTRINLSYYKMKRFGLKPWF